ncbi:hypothetical protein E1301_Tti003269 [Triplophysa tibetana]|uniref:Uncharacterized protein n=1 Tax=Triplophysa tibetana TaxID=1572043 RepID=A0A5A9PRI1_9TELE|nr:hypothetical protein E1301_Tti003269 [Triplophysa tibetana]
MSHWNAMPSHRMSLAVEEFPQPVGLTRAQEGESARSILQKRMQFNKIKEEVDEEGPHLVDEEKARRSFLLSLESLRRCTQGHQ